MKKGKEPKMRAAQMQPSLSVVQTLILVLSFWSLIWDPWVGNFVNNYSIRSLNSDQVLSVSLLQNMIRFFSFCSLWKIHRLLSAFGCLFCM